MDTILEFLVLGVVVVGILFGVSLLFALPTMILWNWLMPAIFGITKIGFWQAWGINFLSGILFKSSTTSSKK